MEWSGDYGSGLHAWQKVFEEAVAADDPDRTPARLAQILLATDPILDCHPVSRFDDLPPGGYSRAGLRAVACELLAWVARCPDRPEAGTWEVLGLLNRVLLPRQDPRDDPRGGEPARCAADHVSAIEAASRTGYAEVLVLALLRASTSLRNVQDLQRSMRACDQALEILGQCPSAPTATAVEGLSIAVGRPSWFPPASEIHALLSYRAHDHAADTYRELRDYDSSVQEWELAAGVAETLTERYPLLLAAALFGYATVAHELGDIETVFKVGDRQRRYAQASWSLGVQRYWLNSGYYEARFNDNWVEARQFRLERLGLWIEEALGASQPATPEAAMAAAEAFERQTRRAGYREIGNDCYQLAADLADSGRAGVDEVARLEAGRWLDAAAAAWADIGLNGFVAIGFRRLELAAIGGVAGDPVEVGRRMVGFSRRWRRAQGQRRSAVEAVRWGGAGDVVVLERLLELRDAAPRVDAGYLDVGIGNWYLRAGDALAGRGDFAAAAQAWRDAIERGAAAAGGLSVARDPDPPLLLHPGYYLEALQVQAYGMRRLRECGRGGDAALVGGVGDELAVRVKSLPAIAQRLSAATTAGQRDVVNRLYSGWLVDTAELACRVGDCQAADAVTEVARRDMVGTILFALTSEPDVPQQISQLARRLVATLNAKIGLLGDGGDRVAVSRGSSGELAEDEDESSGGSDSVDRAARVDGQLGQALDVTGNVIGPVARSLFDPDTVVSIGCRDVLELLHPAGVAAVLSLWLMPAVGGGKTRLLRRLVWRGGRAEPTGEYLDIVEVPSWLVGLSDDADPGRFPGRVQRLGGVLLPPPLVGLLGEADAEHPVGLTIVPSGLLGVPFAAVRLGDRLLVDLAVINLVQSLQTAKSLAQTGPADPDPNPVDLAIYDMESFDSAEAEFADLQRHRPNEVHLVGTLAELQDRIGNPTLRGHIGVLAMAVHGTQGDDGGWSQAKIMPSGETLTAGHILQWYIPRLVVGGSCDTSIRTDTTGELGGFPVAFQLRGAATIVGTLYDIEDLATAQIMGIFYANLAAGQTTAQALRSAQRAWINTDRTTRPTQTRRWSYLVTYGTPN